jgi:hypothetical protein
MTVDDFNKTTLDSVNLQVAAAQISYAILIAATGDQVQIQAAIEEVDALMSEGSDLMKTVMMAMAPKKEETTHEAPKSDIHPIYGKVDSDGYYTSDPTMIRKWDTYPPKVQRDTEVLVIRNDGCKGYGYANEFGWTCQSDNPVIKWKFA